MIIDNAMLDALILLALAFAVLIVGIGCVSSSDRRRGIRSGRRSRPIAPDPGIAAARAADWSFVPDARGSAKGPLPLGRPKKEEDREY